MISSALDKFSGSTYCSIYEGAYPDYYDNPSSCPLYEARLIAVVPQSCDMHPSQTLVILKIGLHIISVGLPFTKAGSPGAAIFNPLYPICSITYCRQ